MHAQAGWKALLNLTSGHPHNAAAVGGGGGRRPSHGVPRLIGALRRHGGGDAVVGRIGCALMASLVGQAGATENLVRVLAFPGGGATAQLVATLRHHPTDEKVAAAGLRALAALAAAAGRPGALPIYEQRSPLEGAAAGDGGSGEEGGTATTPTPPVAALWQQLAACRAVDAVVDTVGGLASSGTGTFPCRGSSSSSCCLLASAASKD